MSRCLASIRGGSVGHERRSTYPVRATGSRVACLGDRDSGARAADSLAFGNGTAVDSSSLPGNGPPPSRRGVPDTDPGPASSCAGQTSTALLGYGGAAERYWE